MITFDVFQYYHIWRVYHLNEIKHQFRSCISFLTTSSLSISKHTKASGSVISIKSPNYANFRNWKNKTHCGHLCANCDGVEDGMYFLRYCDLIEMNRNIIYRKLARRNSIMDFTVHEKYIFLWKPLNHRSLCGLVNMCSNIFICAQKVRWCYINRTVMILW